MEQTRENGKGKKRILIVAGSQVFARMFAQLLTQYGYEATTANDGKEGAVRYRNIPPDLVIVNMAIGEKDGLQNLTELHRAFAGARLIALTGKDAAGALCVPSVARGVGVRRAFSRPFRTEEVLEAIEGELSPFHT